MIRAVLSDSNKRFLYDVGVYNSEDDEADLSGMGDFLGEMADMMSQATPTVSRCTATRPEYSRAIAAGAGDPAGTVPRALRLSESYRTCRRPSRSCSSCSWTCSRTTWIRGSSAAFLQAAGATPRARPAPPRRRHCGLPVEATREHRRHVTAASTGGAARRRSGRGPAEAAWNRTWACPGSASW
jgi:hypothetical protein